MAKLGLLFYVIIFATASLASEIPPPPEQMPWWGEMVQRFLGQFPEVNGWLVLGFVVISATLKAAEDILKVVSKKTETKKDDKWYKYAHSASQWSSRIVEWVNTPTIKPKEKKE